MSNKIVMAMSGGVDSSVAAALLKEQGFDVVGISLQLWNYSSDTDNRFGTCCSLDDLSDARRVADKIGIPFYIINMEEVFRENVVDPFISDYLEGRTPIPCTLCNSRVKFGELLVKAELLGCDQLATGHYASIIEDDFGRRAIRRGNDFIKDQSYFLFDLKASQINRVLFPLGDMNKDETRHLAKKFNLPVVSSKRESQEICFVPNNDYSDFLSKQVGEKIFQEGRIVDSFGKTLGKHRGYPAYTVGQRKGLNIGGLPEPYFVTKINPIKNEITAGPKSEVFSQELFASRVNWYWPPKETVSARVQIRYRHHPASAKVTPLSGNRMRVEFDEVQSAIAPGQAAVVYQDDVVIGGGWIE